MTLFLSILNYIKNPRLKQLEHISAKRKTIIVFQCVLLCIIIGLSLGMLTAILEAFNVYNADTHSISKMFKEQGPLTIILAAVLFAPFFEELIFRAPLTLFSKKYFKIGYYSLAVLFGYIHLFNFEITSKIILFSPILVLPQIVLGLILGYVRVRLGLVYSILLHALYNGVLIIPAVLFLS